MARETRSDARMACEGPRPTMKGDGPDTVARGPVPRERSLQEPFFFHRSAGVCPPRAFDRADDSPPSVVCDRLITNRSESLGKDARASGDPDLQKRVGGLVHERYIPIERILNLTNTRKMWYN